MKTTINPVCARVRDLVQKSHDGNVLAASRDIGVPNDQLWRVVRGHALRGPSPALATAICNYYGITLDKLFGRDETK